jgi:hypothetical protein
MYLAFFVEADDHAFQEQWRDLQDMRDAFVQLAELVPVVGATASRFCDGELLDVLRLFDDGQLGTSPQFVEGEAVEVDPDGQNA